MIYEHKNGSTTYYKTFGDESDPLIVLLHGIGADNDMFAPQEEALSGLRYYVVALDLLAHGKSSKASSLGMQCFADQVLELISHLNKRKASLLGVSMGGVIALFIAANYPHIIDKLIISDSFGELKTASEKILGKSQVLGFKLFKLLGVKTLAKSMALTYKADYAIKAREYMTKVSLKVDLDQMIMARKAINTINVLDALKKNTYEALCICGSEFGKSFIDINRKIADALKTDLVILDNSMDPSNLVNPEKFNQAVREFLTK
jgi:3-oxoadipate enol-lactonase